LNFAELTINTDVMSLNIVQQFWLCGGKQSTGILLNPNLYPRASPRVHSQWPIWAISHSGRPAGLAHARLDWHLPIIGESVNSNGSLTPSTVSQNCTRKGTTPLIHNLYEIREGIRVAEDAPPNIERMRCGITQGNTVFQLYPEPVTLALADLVVTVSTPFCVTDLCPPDAHVTNPTEGVFSEDHRGWAHTTSYTIYAPVDILEERDPPCPATGPSQQTIDLLSRPERGGLCWPPARKQIVTLIVIEQGGSEET
jgi:hypothetical protein